MRSVKEREKYGILMDNWKFTNSTEMGKGKGNGKNGMETGKCANILFIKTETGKGNIKLGYRTASLMNMNVIVVINWRERGNLGMIMEIFMPANFIEMDMKTEKVKHGETTAI